jgi:uncharacterized protein (TIRG00374 family)
MRNLLVGLILLLGVLFIVEHFAQLESILELAQKGDWRFIVVALLIQALWFIATGASYAYIFRAIGIRRGILQMAPVAAAANFVNIVAPSGGMSSLAVIISDARRNRVSSAHATVAGALFVLIEYLAFTFFLVLGLFVLFRRGGLNAPELFASGFLWLSASVLALVLYLGMRSEEALAERLVWVARRVNRISKALKRGKVLGEKRAAAFAHKIAEGLVHVKERPQKLLPAVVASFIGKSLWLLVFWMMFLAFKIPLSAGTLFAGFALAYLFMIVSPTPAGIGFVEGVVTLSLVSMTVPVGAAAVVVLGYRAITFWLPLVLGMLAMQRISGETSGAEDQIEDA